MKTQILLLSCLVLAQSPAKDGAFTMPAPAAAGRKVIPAAELQRRWNASETRTFAAPATEKRTAIVSDAHLAALEAAGATRGIAVVPVGNGQNQVTCNVDASTAVAFQNIMFKINSTELADRASLEQVEQIAQAIKASGAKSLVLEGHTCDLGTDGHNQSLSERRAAAIQALLMARGVPAASLLPLGFGESQPGVPNTSEANREANRRVVISLRQ